MDVLKSIVDKIINDYGGELDCSKERADLFVYLNGEEASIKSITTEKVVYESQSVKLIDSDIQTLVYIDNCI